MIHLNAHERPPDSLKDIYKKYQKCTEKDLSKDIAIIDIASHLNSGQIPRLKKSDWLEKTILEAVFTRFVGREVNWEEAKPFHTEHHNFVYESTDVQGLVLIPGVIPPVVQEVLIGRIFHRDLSNASHNTNIDLHYDLVRPGEGRSFFQCKPTNVVLPKNSSIHKPMSIKQLLSKKLRWMTLGGQYDWTRKVYPEAKPPDFPADLRELLLGLFPDTDAQAAIVNLYSPGDTLSLHRDVSEQCDRGLISLSIGCDCLFVIGYEDEHAPSGLRHAILRLRSGDVVLMAGRSRYAWHGVPLIIPNTCPGELRDWPRVSLPTDNSTNGPHAFEQWTDWMSSKRININVRQMQA